MVENKSYMFLTGPNVIKSVTGEDCDFESLGGAAVHLSVSGTAHLTSVDEEGAIGLCRSALSYLPSNNLDNTMQTAIEQIVDRESFLELQSGFARNAIVGLARLDGRSVGIISQEPNVMAGVLDIDSSDKICRMVRLCDAFNLPIITFVDSPGFLPGVGQEHGGVIRHGAKVLYAYSEANVPKISVVTRKAYGGAYVVMSSKYLGTDISYAWPSAEIAVMGAEGAVNILYRNQIARAADGSAERKRLEDEYRERYLNPYAAAKAGYIDDVIEPADTRHMLITALDAIKDKVLPGMARKHGNMPV